MTAPVCLPAGRFTVLAHQEKTKSRLPTQSVKWIAKKSTRQDLQKNQPGTIKKAKLILAEYGN